MRPAPRTPARPPVARKFARPHRPDRPHPPTPDSTVTLTNRTAARFARANRLRAPRRCKDNIRGAEPYRHAIPWRNLLKRIFGVDALKCLACGAIMTVVAVIEDRAEAACYLAHMGLKADTLIRGPPEQAA